MATTRIADHLGRVLDGRYRLLAPIGTGASAHVFLADDVRLGRRVAVKILHPALADDAAFLKRFRAEARAAAALSHPHILAIYDWGEEAGGQPFIVTEYLGGGSLRSMLDRGHRLSTSQALLVGLEASRALDFAHRRGFVHRDVKPANLLFDEDGRLRVADFGLARALAEASWTEPTGGVVGSARYASPEQAQGRAVDGRSDVYALALLLVEAVTGRLPFDSDTAVATLMSRVATPLEVPDSLGPLAPVLRAAGRVDPAERSDAMALGAGLQRVSADLDPPEPLPVAGPATLDDNVIATLTGPPTDLVGMPRPAPAGSDADGSAADTVMTPLVPDDVSTDEPRRPRRRDRRRRRRRGGDVAGISPRAGRRRRWPVAMLVALVALVAGVGAYALVRAQVPSHPVPRVIDMQQSEATAALEALDFEVVVVTQFVDGTEVGQVTAQSPAEGTSLREGRRVNLTVSLGPTPVDIPDLTGLDEAAAGAALTERGLTVAAEVQRPFHEDLPAGQVLDWSPRDQQLPKGQAVTLVVSAGPEPREVPAVAGMKEKDAVRAIEALGLEVVKVEGYSNDIDAGVVARTEPTAGERVERGGTVRVIVSLGRPVVPELTGLSVEAARAALEAVGLKLGTVAGFGGRVVSSSPGSGATVRLGTEVAVLTGFG